MKIALIDADSIVYIVAWNHKDGSSKVEIEASTDSVILMILHNTGVNGYVGSLSAPTNFRHREYLYDQYKGNRPPKDEWLLSAEQIIKDRMINKWGFFIADDLEADDMICALAEQIKEGDDYHYMICSPDKDLRQIPGEHYDYKKNEHIYVEGPQAFLNLCCQLMSGDTTDNIAGLPGIGEAKASKFLKDIPDPLTYLVKVKEQYIKQYGPRYGPDIYQQTLGCVRMLCRNHAKWNTYASQVEDALSTRIQTFDAATYSSVENTKLDALGW